MPLKVDATNTGQLRSWDGEGGDYWVANADRLDAGVAGYHGQLLDRADIAPGSAVLDIGCGSGQTSRDAARRAPGGTVLGVDLSARMLDRARTLAEREGLRNVTFEQHDAQVHELGVQRFDRALSRNGAMFFGEPHTAFGNIACSLRPGAKLTLLSWQPFERNEWLHALWSALDMGRDLAPPPANAPGPFGLSEPDRIRAVLEPAGFTEVRITPVSEPMYYGRDVDDAFTFVVGQRAGLLEGLDEQARAAALDRLRADLAAHLSAEGVHYGSAAWFTEALRG
ncbi:class I SAM-dependent methyltransferase [Sciscionella marina]|uniref:class I SAM-dependent methyltransferase n=1 Tax=Sciscionella marina TaxID=508770 RepID=UPI00037BA632|nr:class I SAM-dependent methyltransferase [Sciscionella marina]